MDKYARLADYCHLSTPKANANAKANAFLQAVRDLLHQAGLDTFQSPVRVCDHEKLIPMVAADSINYSAPVTLSEEDIKAILEQITDYKVQNTDQYTEESIRQIVETQRKFFRSGVTLPIKWRIEQLKKLKAAVIAHQAEFTAALAEDLGRTEVEAYLCDVGPIIVEINEMLSGLKRWARPERHFSGLCGNSADTGGNRC